jgi:hypothetical protein
MLLFVAVAAIDSPEACVEVVEIMRRDLLSSTGRDTALPEDELLEWLILN